MPLAWNRDRSCYACNHYTRLGLGADAIAAQIAARGKKLAARLAHGGTVTCLCGHQVSEYEIKDAVTKLLEPESQAEELLLTHPPLDLPPATDDTAAGAASAAPPAVPHEPLPLRDALAVLWLLPPPTRPGPGDPDVLFDC